MITKIYNICNMYIRKLIEKLGHMVSGYLAYCQDCGHLKELIYFKDTQKFMRRECINRYAKLYIKMNKIETNTEKDVHNRYIGQVV